MSNKQNDKYNEAILDGHIKGEKMTIITDKMRLATLEIGKGYTSQVLIELLGEKQFKNLVDNKKLKWVRDNSVGDKLYAREIIK